MKKEELIEKYPELLEEIAQGYSRKIIGKLESNKLNFKDIWNEYLEENKPKSDFQVICIKIPHHSELWLSDKTNHFCEIDGKNVIEYEKALLIGEIKSVVYKGVQYSIDDVVDYNGKLYEIKSFDKETVNLKERNGNYYYEPHISEIKRIKSLGITEDGFECYEKDNVHWVYIDGNKFTYSYALTLHSFHFENNNLIYPYFKIFKLKENALKFIEDNTPKSLFISEDGVDIKEGNTFYYLTGFSQSCESIVKEVATKNSKWKNKKTFFKYKNAEQEQLKHAKVLSYDDIKIYLSTRVNDDDNLILNLVKERLNQK